MDDTWYIILSSLQWFLSPESSPQLVMSLVTTRKEEEKEEEEEEESDRWTNDIFTVHINALWFLSFLPSMIIVINFHPDSFPLFAHIFALLLSLWMIFSWFKVRWTFPFFPVCDSQLSNTKMDFPSLNRGEMEREGDKEEKTNEGKKTGNIKNWAKKSKKKMMMLEMMMMMMKDCLSSFCLSLNFLSSITWSFFSFFAPFKTFPCFKWILFLYFLFNVQSFGNCNLRVEEREKIDAKWREREETGIKRRRRRRSCLAVNTWWVNQRKRKRKGRDW